VTVVHRREPDRIHPRRVVVTGIGLATTLGAGREATWQAIREGRTGASRLHALESRHVPAFCGYPAPFAHRFEPGFDPVPELLRATAREALDDANLSLGSNADPDRAAVLVGLSKGRMASLEQRAASRVADEFDPSWIDLWPNAGARQVARLTGARGACLAPVAACATGLVAALQGADLIRRGDCDVAIVGAADASLTPFVLGAFRSMRALARVSDDEDPALALRPWHRARKGFLVGEGAAILVLEDAKHALARGARVVAELAGGALGGDGFHLTDQNPNPSTLAALIGRALNDAQVQPDWIDHVSLHGTATRSNDPLEARALRQALGPDAAEALSCSASKAQIGHLLGAAGAVELALEVLAVRDQFSPPTLHLDDPDPICDLDATPLVGRSRHIKAALKLSMGFGGHLAAAVLKRPDELAW
jgi:3-oxoacyl-[acyl-carrier-protein] synthase II